MQVCIFCYQHNVVILFFKVELNNVQRATASPRAGLSGQAVRIAAVASNTGFVRGGGVIRGTDRGPAPLGPCRLAVMIGQRRRLKGGPLSFGHQARVWAPALSLERG